VQVDFFSQMVITVLGRMPSNDVDKPYSPLTYKIKVDDPTIEEYLNSKILKKNIKENSPTFFEFLEFILRKKKIFTETRMVTNYFEKKDDLLHKYIKKLKELKNNYCNNIGLEVIEETVKKIIESLLHYDKKQNSIQKCIKKLKNNHCNDIELDVIEETVKEIIKSPLYSLKQKTNKGEVYTAVRTEFVDENFKLFSIVHNQIPKHNLEQAKKDNPELESFISPELLLVARGILEAEKEKGNENKSWNEKILLAVVMANVADNSSALRMIRNHLISMSLPVRAWLIKHEDHLYNEYGQETYEPIFNGDYLCRVAECMWKLSTQIFGSSYFTYENLAALVREPDVKKVKVAAQRIAIITSNSNDTVTDSPESAIWVGDLNWKWNIEPKEAGDDSDCIKCRFIELDSVIEKINNLGEPL
jgi:hypothetical protein